MKSPFLKILSMAFLVLATSLSLAAQNAPPTPTGTATPPAGGRPGGPGGGNAQDPQPYEKVITKDAKTKTGLFSVHKVKDKYYYEIPKSEFGKDFLWVTQIAKTTLGVGYGGQALSREVVRWELGDSDKVYLRSVNFDVVADPKLPISEAVANSNNDSILMAFDIAAYGPDKNTVVIDVGKLFTTDVFEFSAKQRLNANSLDASRTFIERISPYPENIEAESTQTYTKGAPPPGAGGQGGGNRQQQGMRPGSASVVIHYSMVKLPENPMMPRLFDERVGYFTVDNIDYGRDEHRAQPRTFITKWRLEKKDPTAAISEPVKPIVYYIDSATPEKWRPYMIRGVEKWQKAFEAAGFKNAIIAKIAPTKAEDPDFSPEDARYSVIRWLPSTVENASGPHVSDPRTGEILESDIQFYHNVMNLQRSWYFLQVGPIDKRVATLPMPDDLMGVLLEYVCAHEVGHTLGFQHNMKASSMYPADKLRDKAWVHKMGHTPSIMDYSRFNYVAQPEDNIDVADLVPGIGPYDTWATMWGYKPIPDAKTPDQELATLDTWAREQDATPWYRFSTNGSAGSDAGELTEAVGDADAVRSSGYGLLNLKRVAKMLVPATTANEKGQPYDDLREIYGRMLGQWTLEMNHVVAIVGGYNSQQKHVGQTGARFNLIPKARQAEAVKFLNENAFATPTWALDKDILRKIEPIGALNRVRNSQNSMLNNLLSSARFARLIEQQQLDGDAAYQPADFLADVRGGVWRELSAPSVSIDGYRRNLQRSYLDIVNAKLNGPPPTVPQGLPASFAALFISSGDERSYYRSELRQIQQMAGAAVAKAADASTRVHLEAVRDQIGNILDPKGGEAPKAAINLAAMQLLELYLNPTSCFPDYTVEP